jgi:hypothetical protein
MYKDINILAAEIINEVGAITEVNAATILNFQSGVKCLQAQFNEQMQKGEMVYKIDAVRAKIMRDEEDKGFLASRGNK